ncbi:hypothetical protein R83H12_01435 [Fibrobacteria bacterium R8-3-H12]
MNQIEIEEPQIDIEEQKQFLEEAKKYLLESHKYSLVTSKDANKADELLEKKFPDCNGKNFSYKLNFLKNNFTFSLAARYTTKEKQEDIDREDYFATLQYLISEARDSGAESVIRS